MGVFPIPDAAGKAVWAVIAVLGALALSRITRRLARRWAASDPESTLDLARLRRRETAATLIVTAIRYVLIGAAIVAIVAITLQDRLTTAVTATLLAIMLAFTLQTIFTDVIRGFLLLVEGQFGVGDFVELQPSGYAGVVEEVGLRTVVVRDLNGDRYYVPNGQITGVRRSVGRYRRYTIDLLTHDAVRVSDVVEEVRQITPAGGIGFLRPPRVTGSTEIEPGLSRVRVEADVAPTMEWLAEDYLVDALKERAGDSLVTEPVAVSLDDAAVRRYRRSVLVR